MSTTVQSNDKNQRFKVRTLIYLQALVVLGTGLILPATIDRFRPEQSIYIVSLCLLAVFIWSLWSWKLISAQFFDPYVLFFTAAAFFNAGHALLEVFGLNRNGILGGRFPPETTLDTLLIVALGLTSFHLGAMIAAGRNQHIAPELDLTSMRSNERAIRLVAWSLAAISLIPGVLLLRDAFNLVLAQGYFAIFQRESLTGIDASSSVLAGFLVPASLFLLAAGRGIGISRALSLTVIGINTVGGLFIGQRSAALLPLFAYAWLWHRLVRPIPRILLLGVALATISISPVIALTRNTPGQDRLSFATLLESFVSIDNPLIASVTEMGGSMATITHTLQLVPSYREYDSGMTYLFAGFAVFPNFFWDVHPTVARGLPSSWLIWTVDRFTAERGGGLGYSFIAEAYLNFGWMGAGTVLFVIGYLYARFVLWARYAKQPERLAALASFVAFFLFFARSESAVIFRPLVWYALLPYLSIRLLTSVMRSQIQSISNVVDLSET
jgi:oligosaccharide repeat unit polymerase